MKNQKYKHSDPENVRAYLALTATQAKAVKEILSGQLAGATRIDTRVDFDDGCYAVYRAERTRAGKARTSVTFFDQKGKRFDKQDGDCNYTEHTLWQGYNESTFTWYILTII